MQLKSLKRLAPAGLIALLAAPVMAVIVYGNCYGDWDLPSGASTGYAVGLLDDTGGTTVFKMKAELTATPAPSPLVENGIMKGVLSDGSGSPWPQYTVYGKYSGSSLTHEGKFKAEIYRQISPLGPIAVIGKMAGKYSDPGTWSPIGAFKGEWKADL